MQFRFDSKKEVISDVCMIVTTNFIFNEYKRFIRNRNLFIMISGMRAVIPIDKMKQYCGIKTCFTMYYSQCALNFRP